MQGYSIRYTLSLFLFILSAFSLPAQSPDDYWDDRFDLPGVQGVVYGSAVTGGGALYITGDLLAAAGLPGGQTLLKWENSRWNSPGLSGDSLLVEGIWHRITGSAAPMAAVGNTLYIAASRPADLIAGRPATARILALDGNGWRTVGGEINGTVAALAADGANLYMIGRFTSVGDSTLNALARWNGTAWESVGGGVNGEVAAIAADRYGMLYATGSFTRAGNVSAPGGARWDGSAWAAVGNREMNESIVRLATVGTTLYALRQESRPTLYRLDGNDWINTSASIEETYDLKTSFLAADSLGSLYVSAWRRNAAEANPSFLLRLNNNSWSALPAEFNGQIHTPAFGRDARMLTGGAFTTVNDNIVNGIAEWDGVNWNSLAPDNLKDKGLAGEVAAVEADGEYQYAAGTGLRSRDAAGTHAILRRRVDGKWESVGGGINGSVNALARSAAGELYAGGCFDRAGNGAASNVARWDGTAWHPLGSGPGFCVADIAAANGMVYVIGGSRLSRWDGQTWTLLADNIGGDGLAVAVAKDGTVYVGGRFSTAGGIRVNNVAAWRNGAWSPLAEGVRLYNSSGTHPGSPFAVVQGLALDDDYLYAGGIFDSAGSAEAYNIARWNGREWSDMYLGLTGGTVVSTNWTLSPEVRDIRVTSDYVFAGGHFHTAGKDWAASAAIPYEISSGVAFWDKKEAVWNGVGSGTATLDRQAPLVRSIAVNGNELLLGGEFTQGGDRPSYRIARVTIPAAVTGQPVIAAGLDFGAIPVGGYKDSVLTITNPASSTRTLAGRVEITGGPFAATGATTFGVAPGKTIRIPMRFIPESVGLAAGNTLVRHNSTAGPQQTTVPLWGTGLPPVINYTVDPLVIDFGDRLQSETPASAVLSITNNSASTREMSVRAEPLSPPFSLGLPSGNNDPLIDFTLDPKSSIIYKISADLSRPGDYNTQLVIQHSAGGGAIVVPVHLRVITRVARMNTLPETLDFGDVRLGTSATLPLTVGNDPGSNIPINFMSATAEEPFRVEKGNRQTPLFPGRTTELTVSFRPQATGAFEGFVEIRRQIEGVESTVQVPARGRGIEGIISPAISPQELDFGNLRPGMKKDLTLTVENGADATLPFIAEYAGPEAPFSAQQTSHTITPGNSRTYTVRFSPTGTGTFRDTIIITHNAPGLPNPFLVVVRGESATSGVAGDALLFGEASPLRAEPNPTAGRTHIRFRAAAAATARLSIHTTDGREVARLIDRRIEAGEHSIEWQTETVGSGIYLCRLKLGEKEETCLVVVQ